MGTATAELQMAALARVFERLPKFGEGHAFLPDSFAETKRVEGLTLRQIGRDPKSVAALLQTSALGEIAQ